jgi:hypothetical protein
MITKGNQRGGGRQLATHLLNAYDNEYLEVTDLRGSIADDLHGAFAEWYAQSKATKCVKYLYSLSINPPVPLNREQYREYVARIERKLGLADQPRAVVFHVKQGREHCHVVWSRIDTDRMKAVQISHDRQIQRLIARAFARDHGLTLPKGMEKDLGSERFARNRARRENLKEKQQQERTGIGKSERREAINAAWKETDTGRAFAAALERRGYFLARGDDRPYVVVDLYSEVHSLSRQLDVKAAAMRQRLLDLPVENLPGIEAAREHAARQRASRVAEAPQRPETGPAPPDAARTLPTSPERRAMLADRQQLRRAVLDQTRAAMGERHAAERAGLRDLQQAAREGSLAARAQQQPKGVIAFLIRITGLRLILDARHVRQDRARDQREQAQTEALHRRHERERQESDRRDRALTAIETRERRAVESSLRREEFQKITNRESEQELAIVPPPLPDLTQEFGRAGAQSDKPEPPKTRGRAAELFNRLAGQRREAQRESGGGEKRQPVDKPPADLEPPATAPPPVPPQTEKETSGKVAATFNRLAARRRGQQRSGEDRSRGGPDRDPDR